MKTITLFISPDGSATGLYDDLLLEVGLGTPQIERASNVEFNHSAGRWEATFPTGEVLCSAETREACLRGEAKLVTAQLERRALAGSL